MNLRDFIAWRGDLTFDMIPFNHIDAAIFSELSMIDWDDFLIENDKNVKMTPIIPGEKVNPNTLVFNKFEEVVDTKNIYKKKGKDYFLTPPYEFIPYKFT